MYLETHSLTLFRPTGATQGLHHTRLRFRKGFVLKFNPSTNSLIKLHQETCGKSVAGRVVPGQFLATNPKGRAVMIAAMEKSKLVYILNRDLAGNLTISSPLELINLMLSFIIPSELMSDSRTPYLRHWKSIMVKQIKIQVEKHSTQPKRIEGQSMTNPEKFSGPSGGLICCKDFIIYKHQNDISFDFNQSSQYFVK
ncbi:hypothetical protein PSTT_00061 [Puccinia striiformis]|uniref:RSE1/DDB1/CPSF1 first beta-propeller domain-containing protein n=1 Tax=Puccinia striiformis TaxID=27350 RepID=A0A2S4W875_9BASI|nr:hypothetical protein PSTT_00061 [Puccinia striiformis]